MADTALRSESRFYDSQGSAVDAAVGRLEELWNSGHCPELAPLLPPPGDANRLAVLVELIKVDQERRWKAGLKKPLEEYLVEWPELPKEPSVVPELLAAELQTCAAFDTLPSAKELQKRFSDLPAEQIQELLREAHDGKLPHTIIHTPPTPGRGSGLTIRCPSCHTPMPVAADTAADVTCSSCGTKIVLVDPPADSPPIANIGRFVVSERIGLGGFGSVWKARDPELDRTVAIKIPRQAGMAAEEQERFLREAQAAAQLRHPNIVTVHEIGRDGDLLYIVSDSIEGKTLDEWRKVHQPSDREVVEVCTTVADAVHYAHERGVIHRDLKPSNIMIGGDGNPHLMDFGLARRESRDVTMTLDGFIVGTPDYMAPEQARGEAHTADARSDVYSLGVILFELLTGKRPFRGAMPMIIQQVVNDDPPTPRKFRANVPKDLETIALKCMEKEPNRRYQSANDFAAELRRFLVGEPIEARPISKFQRGWRWAKRRPTAAALMITVVAILIIGPATAIERNNRNKEFQTQLVRNLIDQGSSHREAGRIPEAVVLYTDAYATARKGDPLQSSALHLMAGWVNEAPRSIVHDASVTAVAFSPDGSTILTGSADGTAQLWDSAAQTPVGQTMHHKDAVTAVAFSPDGQSVLTGSEDKTARLWKATSQEAFGEVMRYNDGIWAVAFSPNGQMVATGSRDGSARLWSASTGKPLGNALRNDRYPDGLSLTAVAFSPDSCILVTGSFHELRLWDTSTGLLLGFLPSKGDGDVATLKFSPDGKRLLAGVTDEALQLSWDVNPPISISGINPMDISPCDWLQNVGYVGDADELDFSPDGNRILTGSMTRRKVQLIDTVSGRPVVNPICHDGWILAAAFRPDGKQLLTGCRDGLARLWDVPPDALAQEASSDDTNSDILAVAVSPNGRTILTGHADKTARFSDACSKEPIGNPLQHGGSVFHVAFSQNGRVVLTASKEEKLARLWDAVTRSLLGKPIPLDSDTIPPVLSPDGRRLLTKSDGNSVRVWDTSSGDIIGRAINHENRIMTAIFSPDGDTILTCSADTTARLWNASTGEPRAQAMRHRDSILTGAFSPDGRKVVTADIGTSAQMWDAKTGTPLGQPMRQWGITAVAFSPNGQVIATGSLDHTARLWDTGTGDPLGEPMRHDDNVWTVGFNPDGSLLLTTTADETLHDLSARIWDVATQLPITKRVHLLDGPTLRPVFTADGVLVVTQDTSHRTHLQEIVRWLPDRPDIVQNWVLSRTGMKLDSQGVVHKLSKSEWLAAQSEVERLRSGHELP